MTSKDQSTSGTSKAAGQGAVGIQGQGAKDVTTVKQIALPNSWGSIGLDSDQLSEMGRQVGEYRAHAAIRGQKTVYFGNTSSTYHSRGKVDDKHTVREVTVKGKAIKWQVTPAQPELEQLRGHLMLLDLWQNYVKSGESALFGIWLDFSVMIISDETAMKIIVCGLSGESEEVFNAYKVLAVETIKLAAVITGAAFKTGASVFVKPSNAPAEKSPKAGKATTATSLDDLGALFA